MGHQRLGEIPKSKRWTEVVAAVSNAQPGTAASATAVGGIAARTIEAAQGGLQAAIGDAGLGYTFYLLTQVALAARQANWREALADIGVRLDERSSVFELTSEVQRSIDDYLSERGRPTDVSEIAQQAAGEALAELAGPNARTLFGSGSDELQDAVRKLSTKAGFAKLGQGFFGRFMARFLNFYLSRVTAGQVGQSIRDLGELKRFDETLVRHCHQSAAIVQEFCGQWYSKTEFREGIDPDNTGRFMAVALKKLQAELETQREGRP